MLVKIHLSPGTVIESLVYLDFDRLVQQLVRFCFTVFGGNCCTCRNLTISRKSSCMYRIIYRSPNEQWKNSSVSCINNNKYVHSNIR